MSRGRVAVHFVNYVRMYVVFDLCIPQAFTRRGDDAPHLLAVVSVCNRAITSILLYISVCVHTYVHTYIYTYGTFHKKLDDERRSVCVRTVTDRALTAVRTAYVRVLFVPTRFLSL